MVQKRPEGKVGSILKRAALYLQAIAKSITERVNGDHDRKQRQTRTKGMCGAINK